jgi:hypothetical protein
MNAFYEADRGKSDRERFLIRSYALLDSASPFILWALPPS